MRILRYWQQMVNCRNPRCRYGCAAYPDRKPHGPYYWGDVQDDTGKVRHVYMTADASQWADDKGLDLPPTPCGAPINRATKIANKTRRNGRTATTAANKTAPALSPLDEIAKAFLDRRPTAKDALGFLNSSRDAKTIKSAIRRAAMTAHPDKGGTVLQMQAVNRAKELLTPWL
jgi:hypothetical protein